MYLYNQVSFHSFLVSDNDLESETEEEYEYTFLLDFYAIFNFWILICLIMHRF